MYVCILRATLLYSRFQAKLDNHHHPHLHVNLSTLQTQETYQSNLRLQLLNRRRSLLRQPTPILPHMLLPGALILLELLQLGTIHQLGHVIRLPLLELKPEAFVAVVFVVGLVFVVFDLDEVGVNGAGVEG